MATIQQIEDGERGLSVRNKLNATIAEANKVDTIISGYQGSLAIANTPTNDGYYLASQSGTYTNAGNLVVDLALGLNFINKSGASFSLVVVPVNDLLNLLSLTIPVETNLIDLKEIDIFTNSYINSTGGVTGASFAIRTDYLEIPKGLSSFRWEGNWPRGVYHIAFYDKDKNFISNIPSSIGGTIFVKSNLQIPNNAVFLRASSELNSTIRIITETISSYVSIDLENLKVDVENLQNEILLNKQNAFGYEPEDFISINHNAFDKLPNLRQKILAKDGDINIVFQGTSMTNGVNHTSEYQDAPFSPIQCDQKNLTGRAWRFLKKYVSTQQYRRYDSNYFTETGTWVFRQTAPEWDDERKYPKLNTTTTANATLAFQVPINSWAFRFLYTAETAGTECSISIAQGDNKLQVFDRINEVWVEANGFVFTTFQNHAGQADYDLGIGNTVYGRRLEFRSRNDDGTFDTRNEVKNITITKSSTANKRLSYWGVEWSNDKYMLSIINAGRSGNKYSLGGLELYSPNFVMTDIVEFKPTLVVVEISHNSYGNNPDITIPAIRQWYLNEDANGNSANQPLSLKAVLNNFTDCDIIFHTHPRKASIYNKIIWNGQSWDMLSNGNYTYWWMKINKPEFYIVNSMDAMVEAGIKFYGSYENAIITSSNDGETLFKDDTHLNNRGYGVWWKSLETIFNFL